MSTNTGIATNYLRQVLAATKATLPFDAFYKSLRLDSIGGTPMDDLEFNDWLESLGFRVVESQKIFWTKPHEELLVKLKASFTLPNMVPTRKTIDSFFLNAYKPTYFDVARLIASQTVRSGGDLLVAGSSLATNVITGAASTISITSKILKYLPYVVYIAVPLGAYVFWKARGAVLGQGIRAAGSIAKRLADKA